MRKYTIEFSSTFVEPYCNATPEKSTQVTNVTRHEDVDEDLVMIVVKDLLDNPDEKMTVEEVKKDFGEAVTNEKAQKIADYYNWRLEQYEHIKRQLDVDMTANNAAKLMTDITIKIPAEYNMFWVYGDDDGKVKQIDAYLKIKQTSL